MNDTNRPSYNVPTKREAMKADQAQTIRGRSWEGNPHAVTLVQFMVLTFGCDKLSKVQREVLVELSKWEGVDITARMCGKAMLLTLKGPHWHSGRAYLTVGPRGGLKGEAYGLYLDRKVKSGQHGWRFELGSLKTSLHERGARRAMRARVQAHQAEQERQAQELVDNCRAHLARQVELDSQ